MNWFDTSNITSLAKSALKEAQKTIDKALEITEDASETAKVNSHVNSDCRQQPSISDHLVPDAVAPRMALIGGKNFEVFYHINSRDHLKFRDTFFSKLFCEKSIFFSKSHPGVTFKMNIVL